MNDEEQNNHFFAIFAQYLRSKAKGVYFLTESNDYIVVFGNASISLEEDRLTVIDYQDLPFPPNFKNVKINDWGKLFSTKEFRSKAARMVKNYTFTTELVYDVKN